MIQKSKIMFEESIKSEKSRIAYTWYVEKFLKYFKLDDFDSVLKIPRDELQDMITTYVIYTKKRVNPNSVPTFMKPVKLFLEVNDIELNWKKITRLYPERIKSSGLTAWTTEDIKKMLDSTTQLKNKAIIHFLASSGVRVGALSNLKLFHVRDMPDNCKMITVYADSKDEYHTFLTPESSEALDNYLNERKQEGEILTEDSILFRSNYTLISQTPKKMTTKAIQSLILRAIKNAAIRGQKKDKRYSTQAAHGFRKRFNIIMKSNDTINNSFIEKMMGHSVSIVLDDSYLPSDDPKVLEKCFEEFKKGVSDLSIDQNEKLKAQNKKLHEENRKKIIQKGSTPILDGTLKMIMDKIHNLENENKQLKNMINKKEN